MMLLPRKAIHKMIKLAIKIETEKDVTKLTPNIFNQNPSKMEQILCNFILDYCSKICEVSKQINNLKEREEKKK